jgi:hypothetical protein
MQGLHLVISALIYAQRAHFSSKDFKFSSDKATI